MLDPFTEDKNIVIAAGPNGSGKSTFALSFIESNRYVYINADDIAKELNPKAPDTVKITAGKIFFNRLEESLNSGRNIILESTLSGMYLFRFFAKIRTLGYKITIIFVFLENSDICIERIKERVKKGGHHVPSEDVIRRYKRSIYNFWKYYKNRVDNWYLIFNSDDHFRDIAIGKGERYLVNNEDIFSIFAARADSLIES